MIDGFFRMAFTGTNGSGFGILVLHDGSIAGADVAGGVYEGTYIQNPSQEQIQVNITLTIPAGTKPVQTGVPLAVPINFPIKVTLIRSDITENKPVLLETPLGPVNLLLKKIRDFL